MIKVVIDKDQFTSQSGLLYAGDQDLYNKSKYYKSFYDLIDQDSGNDLLEILRSSGETSDDSLGVSNIVSVLDYIANNPYGEELLTVGQLKASLGESASGFLGVIPSDEFDRKKDLLNAHEYFTKVKKLNPDTSLYSIALGYLDKTDIGKAYQNREIDFEPGTGLFRFTDNQVSPEDKLAGGLASASWKRIGDLKIEQLKQNTSLAQYFKKNLTKDMSEFLNTVSLGGVLAATFLSGGITLPILAAISAPTLYKGFLRNQSGVDPLANAAGTAAELALLGGTSFLGRVAAALGKGILGSGRIGFTIGEILGGATAGAEFSAISSAIDNKLLDKEWSNEDTNALWLNGGFGGLFGLGSSFINYKVPIDTVIDRYSRGDTSNMSETAKVIDRLLEERVSTVTPSNAKQAKQNIMKSSELRDEFFRDLSKDKDSINELSFASFLDQHGLSSDDAITKDLTINDIIELGNELNKLKNPFEEQTQKLMSEVFPEDNVFVKNAKEIIPVFPKGEKAYQIENYVNQITDNKSRLFNTSLDSLLKDEGGDFFSPKLFKLWDSEMKKLNLGDRTRKYLTPKLTNFSISRDRWNKEVTNILARGGDKNAIRESANTIFNELEAVLSEIPSSDLSIYVTKRDIENRLTDLYSGSKNSKDVDFTLTADGEDLWFEIKSNDHSLLAALLQNDYTGGNLFIPKSMHPIDYLKKAYRARALNLERSRKFFPEKDNDSLLLELPKIDSLKDLSNSLAKLPEVEEVLKVANEHQILVKIYLNSLKNVSPAELLSFVQSPSSYMSDIKLLSDVDREAINELLNSIPIINSLQRLLKSERVIDKFQFNDNYGWDNLSIDELINIPFMKLPQNTNKTHTMKTAVEHIGDGIKDVKQQEALKNSITSIYKGVPDLGDNIFWNTVGTLNELSYASLLAGGSLKNISFGVFEMVRSLFSSLGRGGLPSMVKAMKLLNDYGYSLIIDRQDPQMRVIFSDLVQEMKNRLGNKEFSSALSSLLQGAGRGFRMFARSASNVVSSFYNFGDSIGRSFRLGTMLEILESGKINPLLSNQALMDSGFTAEKIVSTLKRGVAYLKESDWTNKFIQDEDLMSLIENYAKSYNMSGSPTGKAVTARFKSDNPLLNALSKNTITAFLQYFASVVNRVLGNGVYLRKMRSLGWDVEDKRFFNAFWGIGIGIVIALVKELTKNDNDPTKLVTWDDLTVTGQHFDKFTTIIDTGMKEGLKSMAGANFAAGLIGGKGGVLNSFYGRLKGSWTNLTDDELSTSQKLTSGLGKIAGLTSVPFINYYFYDFKASEKAKFEALKLKKIKEYRERLLLSPKNAKLLFESILARSIKVDKTYEEIEAQEVEFDQ